MSSSGWEYAGVRLSIDNYVIPEEKLIPTPSSFDGVDAEMEIDLRFLGCELIQDAGNLLRLPQMAMATAQVLYQRFFYSKSFGRLFYEHHAMACIFLAAKIEECPRRIRDVINVFRHIRQARESRPFIPVLLDQNYVNLKNQVIKAERRVLKELGFCVHGKHPHKLVICYLQSLGLEKSELAQISWNYMNDILRTDVFVRYLPEAVSCACIFLAARKLGIPLPRHPPWWEMFNVDEESVHEIALCLQRLYARAKPNISVLESRLAEIRKKQAEAREVTLATSASSKSLNPSIINEVGSENPSPPVKIENSVKSLAPKEKKASPTHPIKIDSPLIQNTLAAHLSAIKRVTKDRVSGEAGPHMSLENDQVNGSEGRCASKDEGSSDQSRKIEKRRPSAYSDLDLKSQKKRLRRSRTPIPKKCSKPHRRRRSSSTGSDVSYDSRSPLPLTYRSRARDLKRPDYRRRSPGNGKRRKHENSRHRSHSDSSLSSTPSPPERAPRLPRNRSPPSKETGAYKTNYEKLLEVDSNRTKPSKSVNGISSQVSKASKRGYTNSSRRARL